VSSGALLISEMYPSATCKDEYVAIANAGAKAVNLRDWSLTDGEGAVRFDADLWVAPGGTLAVAFNTSSFFAAYHRRPEVSLDVPSAGMASLVGDFALADAGDGVALVSPEGTVVDLVLYGSAPTSAAGWSGPAIPAPRRGEVFKRLSEGGSYRDSDSSSDWTPFREYRYGYTDLMPAVFHVPAGAVTAFTSPDCSLDVILEAIGRARERVVLCSYELSSWPVTDALISAVSRGVDVRILVDGSPAGGIDEPAIASLSALASNGATVTATRHDIAAGIVGHVAAMHAKYMVIDSRTSIVLSENFVEQGVPTDRLHGNRGWGVLVADAALAGYLEAMFDMDSRASRRDIVSWTQDPRYDPSARPNGTSLESRPRGVLGARTTLFPADMMVVPSPDGSPTEPFLQRWVQQASEVLVEQFQADLMWQDRWTGVSRLSPIVASLIEAERRGAAVRVLLDSAWFNSARNSEVVLALEQNASDMSGPSGCRLMDPRNPVGLLHNKGMVIDSRYTVVSSDNWVSAAFARNRELALVLSSEEVAGYFESAFELDWTPDIRCPSADAGPDVSAAMGEDVPLTSNRSWDDRAIAAVAWDIGCDGSVDSENESIIVHAGSPGIIEVRLDVTDAWGNTASDTVLVVVRPDLPGDGAAGGHGISRAAQLVAAAAVSATAMVAVALRRSFRARKVNHGPGS